MAAESNTCGVNEHLVCNLLVKVSGNTLNLNPEVMKLIEDEKQDNIPVVVLSVVGQPKSGKTSVMNSVLKQFGESCPVPKNLFPFTTDDDPRYSELKGEEGVLLWKYPNLVTRKDGNISAWYFMDIWMEYPRAAVYTSLVDFCLSMSSAVIFSEPCNPNPEIYWQPCDSRLQLTINNFCNTLQLHLFLQTDESPPVICQMTHGIPNEASCTTEFKKKLTSVLDAANFLTNRCKFITTTFIPLVQSEQNESIIHPVKREAIIQILDLCLGNPLEVNNQVVNTANLSHWLQQSLISIHGNTSHTSQCNENSITGACTGELISTQCLPYEVLPTSSFEPEKGQVISKVRDPVCKIPTPLYNLPLTDEDIEMMERWGKQNPLDTHGKEETLSLSSTIISGNMKPTSLGFPTVTFSEDHAPCQALTKSKVPLPVQPYDDFTNVFQEVSKYYVRSFEDLRNAQVFFEDYELLSRHDAIREDIIQKYGFQESHSVISSKLSEWFREVQDFNNKRKSDFEVVTRMTNEKLDTLLDEVVKQQQQRLCNSDSRYVFKYDPRYFDIVYQELTPGLPSIWKNIVQNIVESERENFDTVSKNMNALVQAYIENYETLFKSKICLEPSQFENYHQENLVNAKSSTRYAESGQKKLDILCDKVIESHKNRFQELNSTVYGQEEKISKDAYDHATEKYRNFMDHKISSATLTEFELQNVHFFATKTILTLFVSHIPGHQTQPWIEQHSRLEKSLSSLLLKYRQKNQNHLKKVELAKKEGFNTGKNLYQEVMERSLPDTKVSDAKLNECDRMALREAIFRFKEKVADVHRQVSQPWEAEFKDVLFELKQRYVIDNRSKQEKPLSYSAAVRQDVVLHQPPARQDVVLHQPPARQEVAFHQPSTAHTLAKPYGIGLYISQSKVCVGVYVNHSVNFADNVFCYEPPMIAFNAGRVSIGQEALEEYDGNCNAVVHCYNIFSVLQEHKDIEIDVCISGSKKKIGREEILTIYFHRIRMNTEMSLRQSVISCYAVATGLLSGEAKQMLKTCLKIAGFQKITVIPCTTAMAISYALKSKGCAVGKNFNNSIALTYVSSNLIEVASADLVAGKVRMKTLTGDTNIKRGFQVSIVEEVKNYFFNETKLKKRIKNILEVALSSHGAYESIILCYGNDANPLLRHTLSSQLMSYCGLKSIAYDNLMDDIVRVAAALDAIRNQHPDLHPSKVQFPTYSNISPYKIQVKIDKKFMVFTDFNSCTLVSENYPLASFSYTDIVVQEIGRDSQNEWPAAEYYFKIRRQPGIEFILALNEDANLTVSTNPKGLPITTTTKSLVASESQRIAESLKPLLDLEKNNYSIKLQVESTVPVQTNKVAVVGSGSSIDDILRNVTTLVEQVKLKLENSKTTSTAVTENIKAKINKCEDLMNSTDVKIKQLEIEKNNLERAAKLIKT